MENPSLFCRRAPFPLLSSQLRVLLEGWEACPEGPDEVTYSGCWKTGSAAPFPSMTPECILMELLPCDPDSVAQFQETEECAFT